MTKKDFKYYYNQTDHDEPKAMREIHAIRLMHYDRYKYLSDQEYAEIVNRSAREFAEKHGLKLRYVSG
ncbi:MAG: hypothetical protein FJ044_04330 [Candidatus Cloacimonetes bacterium]|nr:hypothetical protein [Candidatus Cloacimonadota bacterium]